MAPHVRVNTHSAKAMWMCLRADFSTCGCKLYTLYLRCESVQVGTLASA